MTNALDYLDWRGDLSFERSPFCEVDLFILSQICSVNFEGIVPRDGGEISLKEAAEKYFALHGSTADSLGVLQSPYVLPMLEKLPETVRFADLRLCFAYNNVDFGNEEQCTALTILVPDGTVNVVFRGTDDTLIGWKEDFNMAFTPIVPAQTEALSYLETVADILSCPLRVGGHSKGGNLAVYASAFCRKRTQDRIKEILNNDGPGHDLSVIRSEGYQRVKERILTILPKSSVIGMLLEHDDRYRVVDSDARGLFQHNPYSWQTRENDFAYLPRTTASSERLNESIREWLTGMDAQKRKFMTDTVFDVLGAGDARTVNEIRHNPHALAPMFSALMKLSPEDRRVMTELLLQFARTAKAQYGQLAADTIQPIRNFWDASRDEGAEKWNALRGMMDMIREQFGETEDGKR